MLRVQNRIVAPFWASLHLAVTSWHGCLARQAHADPGSSFRQFSPNGCTKPSARPTTGHSQATRYLAQSLVTCPQRCARRQTYSGEQVGVDVANAESVQLMACDEAHGLGVDSRAGLWQILQGYQEDSSLLQVAEGQLADDGGVGKDKAGLQMLRPPL